MADGVSLSSATDNPAGLFTDAGAFNLSAAVDAMRPASGNAAFGGKTNWVLWGLLAVFAWYFFLRR